MQAYLILANGRVFRGVSVGCPGTTIGEVVFATGMVGFEETLTDPSYYGQIITQTYPLIGNYGMNSEDVESGKIWAKGYIVREACKNPSNFRSEETLDSFLKKHGIRTRVRRKLSDGSNEILTSIRTGFVSYILNTRSIFSREHYDDGRAIRECAVQNGVNTFTSLDTARIVLDALEEVITEIHTIDENV